MTPSATPLPPCPTAIPSPPAAGPRRPLRAFALGFALSAALIAGAGELAAQGIAGHNSDAPVKFDADRMEVQDKAKRVVLSGNVVITQAGLTLRAARTTLAYSDAGGLKLHRLDAVGDVRVSRADESAAGAAGVYDFDRRIITLVGNVALRRGGDTLNGGRLVIDLASGLSSVDGRAGSGAATGGESGPGSAPAGGGRVSGSFAVPKKN